MALKIIPTKPQTTTPLESEALDNAVLVNNLSEEDKENNPHVSTSQISSGDQNPTNNCDIATSIELQSDASNSSSHETEQSVDKSKEIQANQNSQCVKSDSGVTPMEGIEEGRCNGNDSSNGNADKSNNDTTVSNNLVTSMSANSQVDMNMSDAEFSEKD